MRTGAAYLDSLKDDRVVFLNGERVKSVPDHPALRSAARSIADLYDYVAADANREQMTYRSPATGRPVSKAFLQPRTPADLTARREALQALADLTYGLMGRSPEHFAGFLVGFSLRPDLFAEDGARFGQNIVRYYEHVRDNDLYVSYVLIHPQIDRSKPAHQQEDPTLYAGVVEERDGGIVVSGAQMLGTGGPLSNEVFLSCILPLRPGDENYAISVAVPVTAPGVRMLVRRAYAETASSVYDYPLSSRFDETDALMIFDRVYVPWERVFVYRNIALTWRQFFDTPSHIIGNHQAQVRYASKARFLAALGRRIAEVNGVDKLPPVRTMLGEMASYCAMASGLVLAADAECVHDARGFVYPNPAYVYANNWLQATHYTTLINYVRELAGGGVLQLPSCYLDFHNPEIAHDVHRFIRSPGVSSVERTKLFKLAWDLVGSEFAGRHQQYELFYAGSRSATTSVRAENTYDWVSARAMLDRCLGSYDLPPARTANESTLDSGPVAGSL
jgi:4-hydroxyphenylacetate 3-monooxygenase